MQILAALAAVPYRLDKKVALTKSSGLNALAQAHSNWLASQRREL